MSLSHKRDAMPLFLLLLFPLAEIATFILVGGAIGVVRTLVLVVLSALVGWIMLRDAGVMTALKLQRQHGNPAAVLAEGGARMLAGLLLLIPGFLTDLAAILVLIPSTRGLLFSGWGPNDGPSSSAPRPGAGPDVIEGDFRRLDRDS